MAKKDITSKVKDRIGEPSTYAGLAAIMLGLDQLFNLHGVPEAADIVAQAGAVAAQGQGIMAPVIAVVTGVFAMLLSDKGKKK